MPDFPYEIVSFYGTNGDWDGDWAYVVPASLSVTIDWSLEGSEELARQHTVAEPSFFCRD